MDEIIIGIGVNDNKKTWFPIEKRVEMIKRLYANESRIRVEAYDNLTVDLRNRGTLSSLSEESVLFVILNMKKPLPT